MGKPTSEQLGAAVDAADEFDPRSPPSCASAPCQAPPPVPRECAFVQKNDKRAVQGPAGTFSKRRAPFSKSKPIESTYTFRGDTKPRPTTEQMVVVKGRSIWIVRPNDGSMDGKNAPSNDQIANSLAALDERQLDSFDQVVVNPNQNPDDAYWAKKKNMPKFRSAATSGPRTITHYPLTSPPSQDQVDGTLQHEAGHEFDQTLPPADRNNWKDAIRADKESASKYADTSQEEDFAEFSELYAVVKGTKCQATLKQLYPNRYALMHEYMNRPIVKRQPPKPPSPPSKLPSDKLLNPFEEDELVDPFAKDRKPDDMDPRGRINPFED